MDIKTLWQNKIVKTVTIGLGAVLAVSFFGGWLIGKALFFGALVGAGYLGYQYFLKPYLAGRSESQRKAHTRKYSEHFYDKDAVDKKVKEVMKSRGR